MKKTLLCLGLFSSLLMATDIKITNAYVKQTPPHAKNSAIFLTIENESDKDVALLKAESDISKITELHTHIHENGKMSMVQVPKIEIKAHGKTELKPGGLHIMLLDLKKEIKPDTQANLILYFDNNQSLKLENIESKSIMSHK